MSDGFGEMYKMKNPDETGLKLLSHTSENTEIWTILFRGTIRTWQLHNLTDYLCDDVSEAHVNYRGLVVITLRKDH